jgi:hypothetical protein
MSLEEISHVDAASRSELHCFEPKSAFAVSDSDSRVDLRCRACEYVKSPHGVLNEDEAPDWTDSVNLQGYGMDGSL